MHFLYYYNIQNTSPFKSEFESSQQVIHTLTGYYNSSHYIKVRTMWFQFDTKSYAIH